MRTLFAKLRSLPKRTTGILAVLAAVIAVPAALWAWGPGDRVTFTWDKPASYVTFNSMTNNPKQGDERDFFKIRNYTDGGSFTDTITLEPGKEYEITAYYHNNASTTYNDAAHNYAGVATGAFMRVEMPELIKAGETGRMNAFIGASNAKHLTTTGTDLGNQVWDEVYGANTSGSDILLRYVQNSATIRNNGAINGQQVDLNKLAGSNGALLGYDAFDGKLPGCEKYSGFVTYRIVVDQPDFEITKDVRKADTGTYGDSVTVNAGDEVEFKLKYKNTGTIEQDPVTINDKLPEGLSYVADSTYISNESTGNQWKQLTSNNIVNNGINVGGYVPGGAVYLKFKAKVADKSALKCGENSLLNTAYATTQNGAKSDTATVIVKKDCVPEPEPKYSCDLLTVEKITRTSYKFSVNYTATNGATYKGTVFKIYDKDGNEIHSSSDTTFDGFETGTYTVKAFVTVSVNGSDKTVTSEACSKKITIKEEQKPAIKIEKLVDGVEHKSVGLNQEFTYQIKVTNTGNVDLKDAVVTDKAPTGVTFISASAGEIKDNVWTTTIADFKVGESKSYTIKAKVPTYQAGKIKNTVCVDTPTIPGKPDDCDDATVEVPPTPEQEKVCELETKKIITINKDDFNSSKHSRNLSDCDETPVTPPTTPTTPETPTELPKTGAADGVLDALGLGALVTVGLAYIGSRRGSIIG